MNRRFLFILPLFLVLFTSAFISNDTEGEKFAKNVFECLKANDSAGFKKLVITSDEFGALVDQSIWSDRKKEAVKARLSQHFLDSAMAVNFRKLRKDQFGKSIVWTKAVVDSVSALSKTMDGMPSLRFNLYFTSGARHYTISGDKVLQTPAGWKISNPLDVYAEP